MYSSRKNIFLCLLVALISITLIGCSEEKIDRTYNNEKNPNAYDKIYFTKWDSYLGYTLHEKSGYMQIAFLDYNNYNDFCNKVKSIELMPTNNNIQITDFNITKGNKYEEKSIRTVEISFKLKKEGKEKINMLKINLIDGKSFIWDIGSWKIDIINTNVQNDLELGVRSFYESVFETYFFKLKNISDKDIYIKELVYDLDKKIDLKLDSNNLLNKGKSLKVTYKVDNDSGIVKNSDFYYFKPLLIYEIENEIKYYPLDFTVYSGNFTSELTNRLKKEGRYKVK